MDVRRNEVWVDVNGVGYRVKTQNSNLKYQSGEMVELYIHTAVREDDISLYGFKSREELELFEMLIEVSGVGPKTAMEILAGAKVEEIEKAIREADVAFFSRIKGIGKKSAQRIIIDLKNKIGSLKDIDLGMIEEEDAVALALKQFGFKAAEIEAVMKQIDRSKSEEAQVKEGLRLLSKSR